MNLFKTQSDLFHRIISPAKLTDGATGQPLAVWKVLVFDDQTTSLMANFKVGDLRESNITLHMNVKEKKEPISGVEAIYVISPDPQSIKACINDIETGVFTSVFLNFVGAVDKKSLSGLTDALVRARKTYVVQEIKQYALDFTPITHNSFSLCLSNSTENQTVDFEDEFATKILNLFVTLECVPLIAYDKTSERLKRIHGRLSEAVEGKNTRTFFPDFDKIPKNNKTLLIFNESAEDPGSFLFRSFEFLPLMAETFNLFQNRVTFYSAKIDDQKVTVDLKTDKFLQKNMTTEYPNIGLLIHDELELIKKEHDRILKRPENEADQLAFAENFNEALEAVPIVTEKQKNSENHVRIATQLNKQIQASQLEKVCVLSSQLWRNRRVSSEFLLDLEEVLKSAMVSKTEKLRLFVLLGLNWVIDVKEYERYEAMLNLNTKFSEAETAFLLKMKDQKFASAGPSGGFLSKFKNSAIQKLKNIASEKYRCKVSSLVSNFLKRRDLDELKVASLNKSIDYVNPDSITQVIVMSVDGGNLTELFELNDLAGALKKDVLYGATEMLTGAQFLERVVTQKTQN